MNPNNPQSPREEMEARLTALLLGELPEDQAAALREFIGRDEALAKLHSRLEQTIAMVRETAATWEEPAMAHPAPLKLSGERREKLLAQFKTVAPKEFKRPEQPRRNVRRLVEWGVAAVLVALLGAMLLPALSRSKSRSLGLGMEWDRDTTTAAAPTPSQDAPEAVAATPEVENTKTAREEAVQIQAASPPLNEGGARGGTRPTSEAPAAPPGTTKPTIFLPSVAGVDETKTPGLQGAAPTVGAEFNSFTFDTQKGQPAPSMTTASGRPATAANGSTIYLANTAPTAGDEMNRAVSDSFAVQDKLDKDISGLSSAPGTASTSPEAQGQMGKPFYRLDEKQGERDEPWARRYGQVSGGSGGGGGGGGIGGVSGAPVTSGQGAQSGITMRFANASPDVVAALAEKAGLATAGEPIDPATGLPVPVTTTPAATRSVPEMAYAATAAPTPGATPAPGGAYYGGAAPALPPAQPAPPPATMSAGSDLASLGVAERPAAKTQAGHGASQLLHQPGEASAEQGEPTLAYGLNPINSPNASAATTAGLAGPSKDLTVNDIRELREAIDGLSKQNRASGFGGGVGASSGAAPASTPAQAAAPAAAGNPAWLGALDQPAAANPTGQFPGGAQGKNPFVGSYAYIPQNAVNGGATSPASPGVSFFRNAGVIASTNSFSDGNADIAGHWNLSIDANGKKTERTYAENGAQSTVTFSADPETRRVLVLPPVQGEAEDRKAGDSKKVPLLGDVPIGGRLMRADKATDVLKWGDSDASKSAGEVRLADGGVSVSGEPAQAAPPPGWSPSVMHQGGGGVGLSDGSVSSLSSSRLRQQLATGGGVDPNNVLTWSAAPPPAAAPAPQVPVQLALASNVTNALEDLGRRSKEEGKQAQGEKEAGTDYYKLNIVGYVNVNVPTASNLIATADLPSGEVKSAAEAGRRLEEEQQFRDLLEKKLAEQNADLKIPKNAMVEVVDTAVPPQSTTTWQRVRGALGGKVEQTATARIKVDRDQADIAGLRAPSTPAAYDPYFVQTEVEAIQSDAVLDRVVKNLDLNKAWAGKRGAGGELKTADAVKLLKERLELRPVRNTSLLEISAKSENPQEAAQIANAVAGAYLAFRDEQRDEMAKKGTETLKEQLADVDKKITAAEKDVEQLKETASNQDQPIARKPSTAPADEPQPEVESSNNAFSTFSMNVSDVSFKLAAASLEKGAMPEPASVRSEEFLNAFNYRDPEAPAGVPVAYAWERSQYPFAQNRDLLRFSIKTAAEGREAGRPMNIVLLLDTSGSMERADRVRIIHEALRVLAGQLGTNDTFSVVTFARTARLWLDGAPGSEAAKAAEEVSGITPEGGTNLEEAMKLAYETALRHYLANGINRVVLLTDGAANLGNVDPEALEQRVEANRKQGIALDCFGVGWEDYNDDLLEVLSRHGDGRYGFLNSPDEAASEFAGQLAGALHVAAADVKVQVEFNPARVTAWRQIGYAKHQLKKEQFRDNSVDAAEIGAAESGNALYVIEVNPNGSGPLATVRVRYRTPGTQEFHEHEWAAPYEGNAVALEQADAPMRLAATAGAFAEWLSFSPYASEVTPEGLLGYLQGVPEIWGADARPKKLEWMIRQAKSIEGNALHSPERYTKEQQPGQPQFP